MRKALFLLLALALLSLLPHPACGSQGVSVRIWTQEREGLEGKSPSFNRDGTFYPLSNLELVAEIEANENYPKVAVRGLFSREERIPPGYSQKIWDYTLPENIEPGEYTLTVTLEPGPSYLAPSAYAENLENPGQLIPIEAGIWVDGGYYGKTSPGRRIELPQGEHRVWLTHENSQLRPPPPISICTVTGKTYTVEGVFTTWGTGYWIRADNEDPFVPLPEVAENIEVRVVPYRPRFTVFSYVWTLWRGEGAETTLGQPMVVLVRYDGNAYDPNDPSKLSLEERAVVSGFSAQAALSSNALSERVLRGEENEFWAVYPGIKERATGRHEFELEENVEPPHCVLKIWTNLSLKETAPGLGERIWNRIKGAFGYPYKLIREWIFGPEVRERNWETFCVLDPPMVFDSENRYWRLEFRLGRDARDWLGRTGIASVALNFAWAPWCTEENSGPSFTDFSVEFDWVAAGVEQPAEVGAWRRENGEWIPDNLTEFALRLSPPSIPENLIRAAERFLEGMENWLDWALRENLIGWENCFALTEFFGLGMDEWMAGQYARDTGAENQPTFLFEGRGSDSSLRLIFPDNREEGGEKKEGRWILRRYGGELFEGLVVARRDNSSWAGGFGLRVRFLPENVLRLGICTQENCIPVRAEDRPWRAVFRAEWDWRAGVPARVEVLDNQGNLLHSKNLFYLEIPENVEFVFYKWGGCPAEVEVRFLNQLGVAVGRGTFLLSPYATEEEYAWNVRLYIITAGCLAALVWAVAAKELGVRRQF
jgi:hypothetical protein